MKALKIEPGKAPERIDIGNELEKPCKTLWVATFRCFTRTSTARWA